MSIHYFNYEKISHYQYFSSLWQRYNVLHIVRRNYTQRFRAGWVANDLSTKRSLKIFGARTPA